MELKKQTLAISITKSILNGSFQTQDDVITAARVVMTDLEVSFAEGLEFVNNVFDVILNAQDQLLSC